MAKRKLKKFAEITKFENVLEFPEDVKGNWSSVFRNKNPIILELGCGKGEYTLELARKYPKKNFIGVDIKGERIWRGAKTALEEKLGNVVFLRIGIEVITNYFDKQEVEEIWITFPDPYPKNRQRKKRLMSPVFLKNYKEVLKPKGLIHLKTDELKFFNYTIQVLKSEKYKISKEIRDLYKNEVEDPSLKIQTTYEKMHLEDGRKIYYLCFTF